MPDDVMDNVVSWARANRRKVTSDVMDGVDGDPDEAARAIKLGRTTGDPAAIINMDVEDYATQVRKRAASEIVSRNDVLRNWVEGNPMAARVAADDWHNLDRLTNKVKLWQHGDIAAPVLEAVRGVAEGTREALGESEPKLMEEYEKAPWLIRTIGTPARAKMDMFTALLHGAFRGIHHGAAEAARQVGVDEQAALRFGKGMAELAEWKALDIAGHGGVHVGEAEAFAYRLKLAEDRAKPWTDQGKIPPQGVDPLIDKAYYAERVKHDMQSIDAILDEAEKSLALEREPQSVDDLLRPLLKDKNSAIPFEAAKRLYGEKSPAPGDKKLGDIEGFAEKYEAATRIGGGDIQVPLADWILKVTPEMRRELRKDFKPDAEGMNLEEAAKAEGAEAPIVEFRREAQKIEAKLPPVEEGFTRLWRGSRPGEEKVATAYTSDLPGIALPFRKSYGGKLTYVDVPTTDLAKYESKVGTAPGVEFNVPQEVLQRAAIVSIDDIARQQAGLDQVNALTPVLLEEGASETPLFGKMAIGLTKKDYERWIKTIGRQSAEQEAWELKRSLEEVRRRQSKEWKEDSLAMRPDVTNEVVNRPEWAAYTWFKDGLLRGVPGEKPKLDPAKMTPEQRSSVPKEFQKKGGMSPDDLARMAGFKTGDQMIDVMGRFHTEKGELTIGEYLKKTVDYEVRKLMEATHGKPADIALAEAQDHVTGITQMERLHETTIALGIKAGQTPTFTKEGVRGAAKAEVGRRIIGEQSRDLYLKEAGKYGRTMIEAFLKQDWNEAFRQAQGQYYMSLMANETGKLLDRKAKFEKLAKKFGKATDPEALRGPMSGPYIPYIQHVLQRFERKVGRSPEQINDAIAQGGFGTLEQFVTTKKSELRDIEIPDFWADKNAPKSVERMTGDQFDDFHEMLIAMDKHARDESIVYKEDLAADFQNIRDVMTEKLKELGDVRIKLHKEPGMIKKVWDTYYPGSLTIESILNRWDKDDAMGVFNQYLVRPLTEAANSEARMTRFYQDALRKVAGNMPDMHKMVENSLWVDPYNGLPLELSRRNVLGMLMYWGNRSSRRKLVEGYKVDEAEAYKWLLERTSKEDWDRAQGIGHMFNRLIKLADEMSMKINGVPIKKIEITPFDTIHGRYEGWYNPVEYEALFPGRVPKDIAKEQTEIERGDKALGHTGYYRATTNQAYTKARTEYVAPTAMNMDIIPVRMRQMIHDITFRSAIIQAGKFFYDPKWKAAVIHHYGKEYQAQFVPFLEDVANYTNRYAGPADSLIEHFRQNLIATMIGFNPHTVAKHGMTAGFNSMTEVGPVNFAKAFASLMRANEETGNSNWRFAMDRSEELQRRTRSITQYTLRQPELSLQKMGLRETMVTLGSKPVAFSDLLSAVPTWLAQYEKSMRDGTAERQAVFEADRAVRRAHGSTSITNLPGIMRTNALGRTFTSLYGFFSHMLQKQFELAWKAKDSWTGVRAGDLSVAKEHAPQLIMGFVSYVIIPAVVEEMVTPYIGHEKDSFAVWAAKTMTLGLFASYVGPKDFVRSMVNGGEAAIGMTSTFSKEGMRLVRDLSKGHIDKRNAGNIIKDTVIAIGLLKGYTNAQEGKVLQFFQRWMTDVDRPRDVWEWMHGFEKGTLEKRRH